MNTLQLTNKQAWHLGRLLGQHSDRISKEYGKEHDDYGPILEQLYKDIPAVKQFDDEIGTLISDRDAGYADEVKEWMSRLQSWWDEETTDDIKTNEKCCDNDFVVRFPLNIFPRVVMRYPA